MYYSIGEISNITGIPVSTLRYYDKEGFFPNIERNSGGRLFSDGELERLKVIGCLKSSGMSIKAIKEFLAWCQEGDSSLHKRQEMIHAQLEEVRKQIAALKETENLLRYKCWYYDTAAAAGSEKAVRELPDDAVPEDIREYKI